MVDAGGRRSRLGAWLRALGAVPEPEQSEPVALGVAAIGDAAIHTNPLYGRGCAFALLHAWMLADAHAEHGPDPRALALAFDAATRREIEPWYELGRRQDREAMVEVLEATTG